MSPRRRGPEIPERVTDETITVPLGETSYWLLLSDEEVELLKDGICPARIATAAHDMLYWKRDHYRIEARAVAGEGRATDASPR